jgi:hypothetical protein
MFKRNVGLTDRVVRIVLGLVLLAMVFVGPKIIWGWLGVYPLVTGILGICPIANLFRIDTRPPKRMTVGF